jgi:hypothetical protein
MPARSLGKERNGREGVVGSERQTGRNLKTRDTDYPGSQIQWMRVVDGGAAKVGMKWKWMKRMRGLGLGENCLAEYEACDSARRLQAGRHATNSARLMFSCP